MTNPLLNQSGLPDFAHILPSHVEPAIDHLLARNRERIAELLDSIDEPTWSNLIEPLDEWDDELDRAWSPVSHMNAVVNSDELRDAYNSCLPKLSDYATEMGQNEALYVAYKRLADSDQELNAAQRKVLENALRDFHLSGIDLPADKKARYKELSQQLSQLTSQFSDNLLDATNAWNKQFDEPDALAGLPPSALDLAAQIAQQRGQQGWMLTLDYPSFSPVMTYAEDRELRREVYEAYNTRASDQGPHDRKYDNSKLMEQILALRHEQAKLLGFANYAERSLATKMASSTDEVMDFLNDLGRRSKPQAEQDLQELRDFAAGLGQEDLQPWDVAYYAEKLRHQRYEISQEELKPYFPMTRVIPGMFEVMSRLFGVTFHEVEGVDAWHPDVKFYEVLDPEGHEVAQFYFDLYARSNKRGGAWMGTCQSRLVNNNRCQLPVAYMTCNFTPPVGDKPSLMTHNEVETLFHEFGHGLHHMLTRIDYPPIAGIHGVAWDAVELPSQFMENFCWQRESLALFSGHYETGAPIPGEMFDRMLSAKNFQSAMMMVRQLEFALFDFRIHLEYDPAKGGRIYEILNEVREQVAVVRPPAWNRFAHGFSHIFAGGYAAGYYSYKWAEVLSADAFSLFEENGIFDANTGQSFRDNVLALGGSRDAAELFRAFRGRDPQIDALLRHTGIAA
jgi:oligopeptidase A